MKLQTSALALIGFIVAAPVLAAEQSVPFSVLVITCASCPFIVETAMCRFDVFVTVTAVSVTRPALVLFDVAIASAEYSTFTSTSAGYEAVVFELKS